jgi:hypothetical protein
VQAGKERRDKSRRVKAKEAPREAVKESDAAR